MPKKVLVKDEVIKIRTLLKTVPDQYKSRGKSTIMSRSGLKDFVQCEIFIYIYACLTRF